MTTLETLEKNIAIAEMMGLEVTKNLSYQNPFNPKTMCFLVTELAFDSDWNWLMRAVEWIENLPSESGGRFVVAICSNSCTIEDTRFDGNGLELYHATEYAETKIMAAFEAVCQFALFNYKKA